MKHLISLLCLLLSSSIHAQNSGICAGSVSYPDYYELNFPIGDHLNETQVSVRATPNFVLRLEEQFKVACRGEHYRVLVYCAMVDGIPFVYDVRCKNCEGSAHEWILRKILHTTRFEVVPGSGNLPQGKAEGILVFTVTPLQKR
jgi:hypothetical protein